MAVLVVRKKGVGGTHCYTSLFCSDASTHFFDTYIQIYTCISKNIYSHNNTHTYTHKYIQGCPDCYTFFFFYNTSDILLRHIYSQLTVFFEQLIAWWAVSSMVQMLVVRLFALSSLTFAEIMTKLYSTQAICCTCDLVKLSDDLSSLTVSAHVRGKTCAVSIR